MQKNLSCICFATGSLLSPVTPIAWKNSAAGFFLLPKVSKRIVSPYFTISAMIPASTAAMTAMPTVPNSHFLRLASIGI